MPTSAPRTPRLPGTPAPDEGAGERPAAPPRSRRERWNAAVVLLPTAVLAVLVWFHRWLGDDALIYTRAVRQILAGDGPVISRGERAESSTGTLWQWLVAAGSHVSGADPALVAVSLGLLFTTLGFLAALDAARRLHGPRSCLLPAGVLVLLPLKAVWDYGTSGLETGLTFGWIGCCWWLSARALHHPLRPRAVIGTSVVLGLGPLVRPELGLVTLVLLPTLWLLARPSRRTALTALAAAAALPVGYEIFRAGYYGILVPLPGITKEASVSVWGGGLYYLGNFAGPYWLWLPLALMGVLAAGLCRRRRPARTVVLATAPVLAGLLCATYVVKIGGDFMHARMLLPALFLVLLPVFLVPLNRTSVRVVGAVGVWALCCALLFRPPLRSDDFHRIYDEQTVYRGKTAPMMPTTQAAHRFGAKTFRPVVDRAVAGGGGRLVMEHRRDRYLVLPLADRFGDRTAGSKGTLGENGVVVPLDGLVIDPLGLAYPVVAHQDQYIPGRAGHNKRVDPSWVLADYTDLSAGQLPRGADAERVTAARKALRCGGLAELQDAARAPMTPSRFWSNLTGAWERTQFRFPSDPLTAERVLCKGR